MGRRVGLSQNEKRSLEGGNWEDGCIKREIGSIGGETTAYVHLSARSPQLQGSIPSIFLFLTRKVLTF